MSKGICSIDLEFEGMLLGRFPLGSGFANFIDEWSHCDFCFTNFGVILEYLESSIRTKKSFSDFPTRGPGMCTLS